jgi:hypothetical protein
MYNINKETLERLQAKRNSEKLREGMQQQARALIGHINPHFGQLIVDQFGDMTLSSLLKVTPLMLLKNEVLLHHFQRGLVI